MNTITLQPGYIYKHSNGIRYLCLSSYKSGARVLSEGGWSCLAHFCYVDDKGLLHWSYSTDGHFADDYTMQKFEIAKILEEV